MNKMLKLLFVAFSVSLVLEIHAQTTEVVPTMPPLPLPKKVESLEKYDAILFSLQKSYDQMKTMKASFSQTYTSKLGNEEKSEGTLALKKPGNMKWEYKSPEGKFIVTDGERLVLFDPRTKQAIVQLQDQKTKLPVAVSLLFGGVNLKSAFDVLDAKQDGKITSLVLKPKQTMPNVQKIELELETSKQVRIIGSKISDDLGGTNAMKFTNIQFETKLDKKTFSTAIPKGAAIVTGNPLP